MTFKHYSVSESSGELINTQIANLWFNKSGESPENLHSYKFQILLKLLVQRAQFEILWCRKNLENRDAEKWVWFSQRHYKVWLVWRGPERFLYPNALKAVLYVVSREWLKVSQLPFLEIMLTVSFKHKENSVCWVHMPIAPLR